MPLYYLRFIERSCIIIAQGIISMIIETAHKMYIPPASLTKIDHINKLPRLVHELRNPTNMEFNIEALR